MVVKFLFKSNGYKITNELPTGCVHVCHYSSIHILDVVRLCVMG